MGYKGSKDKYVCLFTVPHTIMSDMNRSLFCAQKNHFTSDHSHVHAPWMRDMNLWEIASLLQLKAVMESNFLAHPTF